MTRTVMGLVSRRDIDDRLYSSWEEIDLPDRPFADDPFGEAFHTMRVGARISMLDVAVRLRISTVAVSHMEQGVTSLDHDDKQRWIAVLEQATREAAS